MKAFHCSILLSIAMLINISDSHSQSIGTGSTFIPPTPKKTEREKAKEDYDKARQYAAANPQDLNGTVKLNNAKVRLDSIEVAQKNVDSILLDRKNAYLNNKLLEEVNDTLSKIKDPGLLKNFNEIKEILEKLLKVHPLLDHQKFLDKVYLAISQTGLPPKIFPLAWENISTNTNQNIVFSPKGTGETTGHIADVFTQNNNDYPILILPQTFFIPSDGKYQSYVGRIQEVITVPPGSTISIPVYGNCANVRTPPVTMGEPTLPVDTWIPVGDLEIPLIVDYGVPVTLNDRIPLPTFTPFSIPVITASEVFIPKKRNDQSVTITWPGTDIPVNGVITSEEKPEVIAPVLVSVLESIESAAVVIITKGEHKTPFHSNPGLEYSSTVQQTFWMWTSSFSDEEYKQKEFAENVYKQFETNTQTTVSSLPKGQKQELDKGISQFWGTFMAIGVEAKVIKNPTESNPPVLISESEKSPCSLTAEVKDSGVKLDYAIAKTGTQEANEKVKEAFKKAIEEAAGIQSNLKGNDTVGVEFTSPENSASAWSLYFPHVVAGRANASAMTINPKNPLKSAWTTEPLVSKANGEHTVILTHKLGEHCKSTLVGVNLAKVRAASGLNASLGNIEALRVINFIGEVAIDYLIQRGKGTLKKLSTYFKDKIKEMAKDEAKEFIKEEMKKIANEMKGKTEAEVEKSMDELIKDIKSGKMDKEDKMEDAEDEIADLLAEILIDGSEFNPLEKIKDDLIDKVDSPIDWSPIQTNTYAIAEGSLEVIVEDNKSLAKTGSGVRYKRKGLEDKEEAEKGGGIFCKQAIASKSTSEKITVKTLGKVETRAGATGEGIFSTGHGIATATLESFNGIFIIAICDCPEGIFYEKFSSTAGFSAKSELTDIWLRVFENLLDDVYDTVAEDTKDFPAIGPNKIPKDYPKNLQKKMEDAAKRAGQIILWCETDKK